MTRTAASAQVELEVPFHDVDLTRAVWHGHYYKYFEAARTALMRGIGYDVPEMAESGYAWPVVETHCKYTRPLSLGDRITVRAEVLDYAFRLRIGYTIRGAAPQAGQEGPVVARGHTVQVAVRLADGSMCYASPRVLLDKLGVDE